MAKKIVEISDHDTLIALNANFETFVSRYTIDIKELKDGTNSRLIDAETRLRFIEKVHERVDPEKTFTRLEIVETELMDFKRYWKAAQIIIGAITFGIGFIFSIIVSLLKIFKI